MAKSLVPLDLISTKTGGLSSLVSIEERVNFYCEKNYIQKTENEKNEAAPTLFSTPGLSLIASISSKATRGSIVVGDYLYVVAGDIFYRCITSDFTKAEEIGRLSPDNGPVEMSSNGLDVFIAAGKTSYIYNIYAVPQPVVIMAGLQPSAQVSTVTMKNQERRVIFECLEPHFLQNGSIVIFEAVDGFSEGDGYALLKTPLRVVYEDDVTFSVNAAKSNVDDQINGSSASYTVQPLDGCTIKSAVLYGDLLQIQTEEDHGLLSGHVVNLSGFSPSSLNAQNVHVSRDSSNTFTIRVPKPDGATAVSIAGKYVVSKRGAFCYTLNPHQLMSGTRIRITGSGADSPYSGEHIIYRSGDNVFAFEAKTDSPAAEDNCSYIIVSPFTHVESIGFLGAASTAELNGFTVNVVPDPSIPGMWQYSKPYAAGDYSALSFATCETFPDDLVAIREVGGNLAMLGSQSLEIWGIGSSENIPFELVTQSTKNIGCVSRENSCVIDESLFFMGKNRSGEVSAYILKDMELVEVGTPDMVAIWASYGNLPICSFSWHYRGHVFYQVEFQNNTWVYDSTSDAWHKSTDAEGAPNGFMAAIGDTSGVSFLSGKSVSITRAIPNSGKENQKQIPRGFTTKSIIDPNKFRILALQIIAESSGKSGGGTLDLEISMNGGLSWASVLPQKSLVRDNLTLDIPRLFWSNLGAADMITFRVIAKSDTDITVTDIWGAMEQISANMGYGA